MSYVLPLIGSAHVLEPAPAGGSPIPVVLGAEEDDPIFFGPGPAFGGFGPWYGRFGYPGFGYAPFYRPWYRPYGYGYGYPGFFRPRFGYWW